MPRRCASSRTTAAASAGAWARCGSASTRRCTRSWVSHEERWSRAHWQRLAAQIDHLLPESCSVPPTEIHGRSCYKWTSYRVPLTQGMFSPSLFTGWSDIFLFNECILLSFVCVTDTGVLTLPAAPLAILPPRRRVHIPAVLHRAPRLCSGRRAPSPPSLPRPLAPSAALAPSACLLCAKRVCFGPLARRTHQFMWHVPAVHRATERKRKRWTRASWPARPRGPTPCLNHRDCRLVWPRADYFDWQVVEGGTRFNAARRLVLG